MDFSPESINMMFGIVGSLVLNSINLAYWIAKTIIAYILTTIYQIAAFSITVVIMPPFRGALSAIMGFFAAMFQYIITLIPMVCQKPSTIVGFIVMVLTAFFSLKKLVHYAKTATTTATIAPVATLFQTCAGFRTFLVDLMTTTLSKNHNNHYCNSNADVSKAKKKNAHRDQYNKNYNAAVERNKKTVAKLEQLFLANDISFEQLSGRVNDGCRIFENNARKAQNPQVKKQWEELGATLEEMELKYTPPRRPLY